MASFDDFDFHPKLLAAIEACGYSAPTPVQAEAIPVILEGRDLIATAQTGTGKTAAFLLPAISRLANSEKSTRGPRILVLVPTRELALQVQKEAERYTAQLQSVRAVCVVGGVPYAIQQRDLRSRYDILVATPGRLIDQVQSRRIDLSNIEMLVLDEADRMLDMGFVEAVEEIAKATPESRQTLLFSATIDKNVRGLSGNLQKNAHQLSIDGGQATQSQIEQRLYYVDNIEHKMRVLEKVLEDDSIEQAIVFTSTKRQADQLASDLQEAGHKTGVLHGDMNQGQRTRTVGRMRRRNFDVLVATDVAARGIDILSITHVVNFDLPMQAEDYIHRIGRTGRAGASGTAISFATYREQGMVGQIQRMTGTTMSPATFAGLEPAAPRPGASKSGSRGGPPWKNKRKSSGFGGRSSGGSYSGGSGGYSGGSGGNSGGSGGYARKAGGPSSFGGRSGGFGGKSEGRTEGRTERRFDDRAEGRTEGRTEGRAERPERTERRFDDRSEGRPERRSEFRPEKRYDERSDDRPQRSQGGYGRTPAPGTGGFGGRSGGRSNSFGGRSSSGPSRGKAPGGPSFGAFGRPSRPSRPGGAPGGARRSGPDAGR